MQVTLNAVRVYGSAAYLGTTPEQQPALLTIPVGTYVLDTTGTQGNATIYLGPPVPWVREASLIRRAIGHFNLEWFRGSPFPTDPDAAIAAAIAQPDAAATWQDSWYVTLVLAQDVDVPTSAFLDKQYVWFVDDPFDRAQKFLQLASALLDRLALLSSTILAPDAFERIIIADHVYFTAPGRIAFGLPEGGMTARLQVSKPYSALDVNALKGRLQASVSAPSDVFTWLEIVTPWWLMGLREEDPWKAFMQLYTGLELLHTSLVQRYYPRVRQRPAVRIANQAALQRSRVLAALWKTDPQAKPLRLCARKDLNDRGEFAVLVLALFPAQADADFAVFERIKKIRNKVVHGHQTIAQTSFPVSDVRELLRRYLDAALVEQMPSVHI